MSPFFSIITVCYNAYDDLVKTSESILSQSFKDYEWIIQDGHSTDATNSFCSVLSEDNNAVAYYSSDDNGIYDAMNKALDKSKGKYIIFMNSGDLFYDNNVLQKTKAIIDKNLLEIYYGNIVEVGAEESSLRLYTKKNSKLWYYALGACLNHQAMFCCRGLFEKKRFDVRFKVCADREWQMNMIYNGANAVPLNITVATVLMDGFSSANIDLLEKETDMCVKKYCGCFYIMYRIIQILKKNETIHNIIIIFERMISKRK